MRVAFLHIAKSFVTELPVSRFTGQICSIPMKEKKINEKPIQPTEVFLASALHAPAEGQGFQLTRQFSGATRQAGAKVCKIAFYRCLLPPQRPCAVAAAEPLQLYHGLPTQASVLHTLLPTYLHPTSISATPFPKHFQDRRVSLELCLSLLITVYFLKEMPHFGCHPHNGKMLLLLFLSPGTFFWLVFFLRVQSSISLNPLQY